MPCERNAERNEDLLESFKNNRTNGMAKAGALSDWSGTPLLSRSTERCESASGHL
jgi:hypothetical protein